MSDHTLFAQGNGSLTVRTTRSLKAKQSGLIIPAGAVGKVIEYNRQANKLMVDFGIANFAQTIDPASDAIEFAEAGDA